jgi:TRAP transporter 4TM/12TM fusion protein
MGFLIKPAWQSKWRRGERAFSFLLVILSLGSGWYLFTAYETYHFRAGAPITADVIWGIILILIVLEATRRITGNGLTVVALGSLLYMYFGNMLPPIVGHRGFSISEIAESLFLGPEGIHGLPLQISAQYVAMFIIFGSFLQKIGGGEFITDLAIVLFGKVRGGPAKVSVMSSSLFGTISGSAVANVTVDGWLTIPLMKRMGCTPAFAAAVEAVSSTGGQIMPPVMGAAAFMIAEFLQMPYAKVAISAAIPALLYYLALFMMLDFEAARKGWTKDASREARLIAKNKLRWTGIFHLIPILGLIYFLFIQLNTPSRSAFWSCILIVAVAQFFSKHRGGRNILESLRAGGEGVIEVAIACGAVGIVLAVLVKTGIGFRLAGILISLAGANLAILLILTMISSLILGMGVPTVACYIIVTVTVAPALIKSGIIPLAAHLFVFYFGVISMITPPVALATYAAAAIAQCDLFKAGWQGMRLGLSGYIVPYMFVIGPGLLLIGSPVSVIQAVVTAIIGIIALSAAVVGYGMARLTYWERIILFIMALSMIKQGLVTDLIGAVGIGFIIVRQYFKWRSGQLRLIDQPLE